MTRLVRMDQEGITGRWFTPYVAHAKWYWHHNASGIPGIARIRFVDVPRDVAYSAQRNSAVQEWSQHPGEFFLPKQFRDRIDGVVPYRYYSQLPIRASRSISTY